MSYFFPIFPAVKVKMLKLLNVAEYDKIITSMASLCVAVQNARALLNADPEQTYVLDLDPA